MKGLRITTKDIAGFKDHLILEERSAATIQKYIRDIKAFAKYAEGAVTRETVIAYKKHLQEHYAVRSVNSMLASINSLFVFLGWHDLKVKALKLQQQVYCPEEKELTKAEYTRLCKAAQRRHNERLNLILQTICGTGIRVSEVRYITVEAAQEGRTTISLKGKIRTILLPGKLCRRLLKYAKKQKITSGEIFLTKGGKPMGRCQIWAEMKRLCQKADVEPSKVFPHNLRHLFATIYYRVYKDIAKLADILGHSSIETTRIYLVTSGAEHARQLERLGLVS